MGRVSGERGALGVGVRGRGGARESVGWGGIRVLLQSLGEQDAPPRHLPSRVR